MHLIAHVGSDTQHGIGMYMINCEIGVFRLDPPTCSSINCIFFKSFIGPSSLKIANMIITGSQLRRVRYQLHRTQTVTGKVGGSIMKLKLQLVLGTKCGGSRWVSHQKQFKVLIQIVVFFYQKQ